MNCKYCNADVTENSKFCNECGQSLFETPSRKSSSKPQGKTIMIGIISAIVVVIFAIVFACISIFGSLENRLERTWSRYASETELSGQVLYTFTADGGTTYTTDPSATTITDNANDEFEWYITDDNELILLLDTGSYKKYLWNPDYANYYLTNNISSYWYLKGNKLYLSNTASPTGYYEYTEYIAK